MIKHLVTICTPCRPGAAYASNHHGVESIFIVLASFYQSPGSKTPQYISHRQNQATSPSPPLSTACSGSLLAPRAPTRPFPEAVLCCAVHNCAVMYILVSRYARPFARTCQFNICISQHSRRTFQPGERLGTPPKRVYIHPSPPSYPFLFSLLFHTYLAANSDDQECRSSSGGSALHSAVVSRMNLLRGLLRCNFCYFKSNPSVLVLRDRDSFHQYSGFISGAVILEKDSQLYCLTCAPTC